MMPSLSLLSHVAAALLGAAACSSSAPPRARDSTSAAPATTPAPVVASAAPAGTAARPDTTRTSPAATRVDIPFTRILSQRASGFDEPAELVIRDRAALEAAWTRAFNMVQGNPAPAMDFAAETVLLVAPGGRASGGHDVHVDAVARAGTGAVVRYTVVRPGPGCATAQVLTSPVEVVRTPRIAGAVRFERRETVQPC